MSASSAAAYRREKMRRLEREVEALREHRARLERLLAIMLRVAVGGTAVEPLALLATLEELDRRVHETSIERGVRVLKETA